MTQEENKEESSEEEIEEDELEEILDEEAFKEIAAEVRAISEAEDFDDSGFENFIQLPVESESPVLEQIAIAPQTPNLEVGAMQGNFQKEKEGKEIKYGGSNGYGLKRNGENSYESNKGDEGYDAPSQLSSIDIASAGRHQESQFGEVTFSNQGMMESQRTQEVFKEYAPNKLEKFDETRTAHSPTESRRNKKYEPRNL